MPPTKPEFTLMTVEPDDAREADTAEGSSGSGAAESSRALLSYGMHPVVCQIMSQRLDDDPAPSSAVSTTATSAARRSRRASRGSKPCRHIPSRLEARSELARWISALDTIISCTAAVAAPAHVQDGPSLAAIRRRSAV